MIAFIVTLMVLVGLPMLFGARSRISRLEYRLKLLEQQLQRASEQGALARAVAPAADAAAEPTQPPEPISEPVPPEEVPTATYVIEQEPRERRPAFISGSIAKATAEPKMVQDIAPPEDIVEESAFAPEVAADAAMSAAERTPATDTVNAASEEIQDAMASAQAAELPAEEAADDSAPPQKPRKPALNFEELFGRKLPIWAGGITLAIAGILIVKYAIDAGFFARVFTPGVQAICGLLFGLGLIGGAEWAYRKREKVDDPRVSQALSGAGISTLYASVLVAANLYQLISPLTAFFGLALVTAGAMGLSLRHGTPSALLGLVGGLATPALTMGMDANVPLLSVYLAFTIAGLAGVSRMQRWPWLALAALVGGAGWSLWLVLFGEALTVVGALSVGGFIMLLAIALPLFVFRDKGAVLLRSASAIVGAFQLAILVAMGGYQPLHWGLFILIAAMGQWLAWRERSFAIVPTLGAALSVLLLLLWPDPSAGWLATIGLALAAIHAGPLLAKLWRENGRLQHAIELSAIAVAIPLVTLRHFHAPLGDIDMAGALAAAGGAVLALGSAALGWKHQERLGDSRFALLLAVGAGLLSIASLLGFADWQAPLWIGGIALALLFIARPSADPRIEPISAAYAGLALTGLLTTIVPTRLHELGALVDAASTPAEFSTFLRWGGLAAAFGLFAWRADMRPIRLAAHFVAAALVYGLIAQAVPGWTLPIVMAAVAGMALLALQLREGEAMEFQILAFAGASGLLLTITGPGPFGEWQQLVGVDPAAGGTQAFLRWASVAALGLFLAWRARPEPLKLIGQFAAMTFAYGAVSQLVPGWTLPIAIAAIGAIALFMLRRQASTAPENQLFVMLFGGLGLLAITGTDPANEWMRLTGTGEGAFDGFAAARWAGMAALAALLAARSRLTHLRDVGQGLAALLSYGAMAQLVPAQALPLVPASAVLGLALWSRRLAWPQLRIAATLLTAIALGWAALPLAEWMRGALLSLGGVPMALTSPSLDASSVIRRLLAPALLLGLALWQLRAALPARVVKLAAAVVGTLALVALHSLYRHAFAAAFGNEFVDTGLGQRLIWCALLIVAAVAAWKKGGGIMTGQLAPALAGIAALHILWYSLVLHNPLWTAQAVGGLPLINLILPLFAGLPLCLWLIGKMRPDDAAKVDVVLQPVLMVMIALFGWATLRQAFHGTLLVEPGLPQFENILRSILGIALAIGYLLWGIRARRRNWRLASLLLMLAAVVKVFLFDASGLEGLLRIASFVALGFSLIGIGWLYSRQLRSEGR
jgi:uncharacterized membrane protein